MKIEPHLLLFASIAILLVGGAKFGGENPIPPKRLQSFFQAILGLVLVIVWGILLSRHDTYDLKLIASNWIPILACGSLITVSSWAVIAYHIKKRKVRRGCVIFFFLELMVLI